MCITHEYQRSVQVLVIPLVKYLVVFLSHLAVIFIESRTNIPRSRAHVLTVGEVSAVFRRCARTGSYPSPASVAVSSSFGSSPGSGLRSGVSQTRCRRQNLEPHIEASLFESLALRRFLDLRF